MRHTTETKSPVRSIRTFSSVLPWLAMPLNKKTFSAELNLIRKVYVNFIKIQRDQKNNKTCLPLVFVDCCTDEKIPFTPEKVGIYLDFVKFFVRPISMLLKHYGLRKGASKCAHYINFLASLYESAGTVYSYCLTTTHRPVCENNKKFEFIYRNDPHYLCVPSLHICIVAGCCAYFKNLFEKEHFSREERELWNREFFEDAVAIGESVLFVKQHSVNCIPAALYMLTVLHNDIYSAYDAIDFINSLFAHDGIIPSADRTEIITHINFMYERLLLEGAYCDSWQDPVKRWIRSYAEQTHQTILLQFKNTDQSNRPVPVAQHAEEPQTTSV